MTSAAASAQAAATSAKSASSEAERAEGEGGGGAEEEGEAAAAAATGEEEDEGRRGIIAAAESSDREGTIRIGLLSDSDFDLDGWSLWVAREWRQGRCGEGRSDDAVEAIAGRETSSRERCKNQRAGRK